MDKPLRILYISHYFPPEVNAPAMRVSEMARRWVEKGVDVTVLTGFPNHPTGIIPESYRGLIRCQEKQGKIKVIRTYLYATPNKGFFKRIINYLSFMFSSVLLGQRIAGKQDIVIATSPQFFVAVAGFVISRLKRCKFVFEVRDVWPEEIVAVRALKNRFIIKSLETVEMFLYKKADLIVTVAQGTIDILTKRGVSPKKMVLIPNGVNIEFFQNIPDPKPLKDKLGLTEKFVIGYIGTHGMAHSLDTVLQAAAFLLKDQEDVHFLFVGDGAKKESLIKRAKALNLPNVIFHDQVKRAEIPAFYSVCDVCLVPLKKADLFTKNIPSKIYEIMASAKPIIISTNGESAKLVESSGGGIAAEPENPKDLTEKILHLYKNEKLCTRMGLSGQAFVLANSSRKKLADEYLAKLSGVVGGDSRNLEVKQSAVLTDRKIRSKKEEEVLA